MTYDNARRVTEMIQYTPLKYLLLETDCPVCLPAQMKGQRNIPQNIHHIVQAIASIKQLSVEEIYNVTYQNACNILQIEER